MSKNILYPLLEQGTIKRMIPDNPQIKNQKYYSENEMTNKPS